MGYAFQNVSNRTQESIQNARGAIFLLSLQSFNSSGVSTFQFYPPQMPLLRREANEYIYQFSAYFAVETIWMFLRNLHRVFGVFCLSLAIFGFGYDIIFYVQLAVILILTAFAANAFGILMTGLFETGRELGSIFVLAFQLMAGIYINLKGFMYLRYFSVFFYTNEALMILFWRDVTEIGEHIWKHFCI